MEYRKLGKTDLNVSAICLGTMTFGKQNTQEEGHEQLDYALDQGVNFIDTAEMYAVPSSKEVYHETERIIGRWIEKRNNRDKFILATKITGPSPGLSFIRNPLNFSNGQINTAIDGSLSRLKTDYIDLYQLHWPERKSNFFGKRGFVVDDKDEWEDNFQAVLESLEGLVKAGKVRHIGVSNETAWGLMKYLEKSSVSNAIRVQTIQNPYNLLNRTFETALAEVCYREEVSLIPYSPLGFGLLTDKYFDGSDVSSCRLNLFAQLSRYNSEMSKSAAMAYYNLAKENGMSLATMALAFVNQQKFSASNIIGATNMSQLKQNIDSINHKLSPEILSEIDKIREIYPDPAP
ncbi:MAG: aryl-alcohol dehydrogenase-like predicted oxidoreductase [Sphingobacteriales bacterium]|jgi:aryl-alcohol dehydrogenase-like predicted oxidoreductase